MSSSNEKGSGPEAHQVGARRLLLTGARGFLGRHCLDVLRRGNWDVHAVTSEGSDVPNDEPGLVWHVADLLDSDVSKLLVESVRPSHLLHLAWPPYLGLQDSTDYHRWAKASLDLTESFAAAGGVRAVLTGSCAEYDWEYGVMVEDETPLRPSSVYGECKRALAEAFFETAEPHAHLSRAWARIFFVYGPGEPQTKLVPLVINALLEGKPARCTHCRQIRDYLYVGDAATALVAILESSIEGAINVGSGHGTVLKDLVGEIAQRLDGEELIEFGALPAPPGEAPRVIADVNRLRDETGWRPAYDLDRGLDESIAFLRRIREQAADR